MQSTNFEFMRQHRPDLADDAADIENVLHGSPGSLIDLLRTFGQRLLQHFLEATGKPIRNPQGKTFGYDDLLQKYARHIPEAQRKQFDKLRWEGNKQHDPKYEPTGQKEERKLLEVAWQLACWVGEQLSWQGIPNRFEPPPEGGHALHHMRRQLEEERRQKAEAFKLVAEAKRSYDVSGWICGDQRNIAAPRDFVGRAFVFEEMKRFLAGSDHRVLVIQGQPGRGKSAIIQRFLSDELPAGIEPFVFYFKDQESQAEPQKWVRHLYASLVKRFELPSPKPSISEAKPEDLVQQLRNRIEEVAEKHPDERLLFVIDGVDEAGFAEKLVWSFLSGTFPNTVQAIATTRPMHSSVSPNLADRQPPMDLDGPDYRINHLEDARDFVRESMPGLDPAMRERVAQLSEGNFLVLQGLCRELRESAAPDIALRELSEHKALGKHLQSELYERTWKRLERVAAEELDRVETLATLLACAPAPLSERIILDMLDLRRGDWVKVQQYFAEYLVESRRSPPFNDEPLDSNAERGHEENSKSVAVFRLFHQTLVEFVRQKFQNDLAEENGRLADYCCRQIGKQEKASYEYSYALHYWPLHLCQAKRWDDFKDLLTDIDFIEKKCKSGKVSDLVADYDLARRNDPDWLTAIKNEHRRQEVLENWAAGVTASGWADEVRRAWQQDEPELVELARPFKFPDAPNASDLCQLLRGKRREELWDACSWPASVRNLESWRTFLTHFSGTFARHPEALVPCAANSSMEPAIRGQAVKLLSERKIRWLEETPRMALDAGIIPLPEIHVSATAFAISADGRRAATGEANGEVRLWDLVTGECLHWKPAHPEQVSHVSLSVDGGRLVSTSKNGLIQVHDCKNFKEIWSAELESDVVDHSFSPEGSIVAVACHDGKVRVLDVEGRSGKCRYELSDSGLEPLARVAIFPEQFCVLAFGNGRSAFWDIATGLALDRLPSGSRDMRYVLKANASSEDRTPTLFGIGQFVCFNVEGRSADGKIALERDGIDVEGEWREGFDDVGLPAVWYSHANNRQLIADGRVVWGRGEDGIRGMDLMACEWPEEFEERRPLLDRSRSQLETYRYHFSDLDDFDDFSFLDDDDFSGPEETDGLQATDQPVMKGIRLFTRITEEPPSDPAQAFVFDISLYRQAYSPDFRILIDFDSVAQDQCEPLYSINMNVPEDEDVSLIQISPAGQYAFVSLTCNWFVWDLATGRRTPPREQNSAKLSAVFPDWKCVALIENGKLVIVDLLSSVEFLQEKLDTSSIGTPCAIQVTADGRRIVVVGSAGISVWSISKSKLSRELHVPGASAPIISPDAEFMVWFLDQTVEVYLFATKDNLLSQPCRNVPSIFASPWDYAWIATDGKIIRTHHESHQLQLTLRNSPEIGQCLEPIVTPTRVFNYDSDAAKLRHAAENNHPLPGRDAPHRTAVCLHCGKRLDVPESADQAIDEITLTVSSDRSSCLHLPEEAWKDPGLRIQCEHCAGPLRLNPFVAW
ncbi:MAG TPA: NACHT domain-containing protein [Pirellulaceae bacterium]|nr:NACHT domain-containing protein [Pirellulaceae bacterium]